MPDNRLSPNFYAGPKTTRYLKGQTKRIQQLNGRNCSSTENRVSFAAPQAYNDTVMTYNTYREQFPKT